jgi:hypothetical protein
LWEIRHPEGANATEGSSSPATSPSARFRRSTPLQHALDRIHSRYGTRGMTRGSQLAALTTRGAPRL